MSSSPKRLSSSSKSSSSDLDKPPISPKSPLLYDKPPISPTHKQCLRLRLQKALSGGSLKTCSNPASPTSPQRFTYSNSMDELAFNKRNRYVL